MNEDFVPNALTLHARCVPLPGPDQANVSLTIESRGRDGGAEAGTGAAGRCRGGGGGGGAPTLWPQDHMASSTLPVSCHIERVRFPVAYSTISLW